MSNVYVQTKNVKGMKLIINLISNAENSSAPNLDGAILIDSGTGNKYDHASELYLDNDLKNKDGLYQYKLTGTSTDNYKVTLLTADELELEKKAENKNAYLNADYVYADGLENKIIIAEIKDKSLVTGFNYGFIAIFDNDPSKTTTINGIPFYKEGTKESPEIKLNCAYTFWYSEDDACFYFNA